MNKMVAALAVLGLISFESRGDQALSFIERKFDKFVDRMVPFKQRKKFVAYHNEVEKRMLAKKGESQEKIRAQIRDAGLKALFHEHKGWASDIQMFLTDSCYEDKKYTKERADVGQFLYWIGCYEKYQTAAQLKKLEVAPTQLSLIDTVKTQAVKVAHKVGDWFKNLKNKLT